MINGKRDKILRILLNSPNLTVTQISALADTSLSWTSEFITVLKQEGIVDATNNRIINTQKAYDYWLKIRNKFEHEDYLVQDPVALVQKAKKPYAFTTYFGETLTQHHLFVARYDIYVNEDDIIHWRQLLRDSGALRGGGNVRLLLSDKFVFQNQQEVTINGDNKTKLMVVSTSQLILDLLSEGGVCQEAAEMMMNQNGISPN